VAFKAGVDPHSARAAVAACEPNTNIIRVGAVRMIRWPPGRVPGLRSRHRLVATIYVRSMLTEGQALTLGNCLIKQPGVLDIGGEDQAPIKDIG
jgi:hypothetical protein